MTNKLCISCSCKDSVCNNTHINEVCIHMTKGGCGKLCFRCYSGDYCKKEGCNFIHSDQECEHGILGGCGNPPKMCRFSSFECKNYNCKKVHQDECTIYPISSHEMNLFIMKTCKRWNFDMSHDITHSWRVRDYIKHMCKTDKLSPYVTFLCILIGMIHDMNDDKYCKDNDYITATNDIMNWLTSKGISDNIVTLVMEVISNMSYSKCKKNLREYGDPYYHFNEYIKTCDPDNQTNFVNIFHIVRHADLLDAYDPIRCLTYVKETRHPDLPLSQQQMSVYDLFQHRMFKHIDDGLIFREDVIPIAKHEERKARNVFNSKEWDQTRAEYIVLVQMMRQIHV